MTKITESEVGAPDDHRALGGGGATQNDRRKKSKFYNLKNLGY